MHGQPIISQESTYPIIVFVQEHLDNIERYPVHTLLANVSSSEAASNDQGNISNNESRVSDSSDEDRTIDGNFDNLQPSTNLQQQSCEDRNNANALSVDEMKLEDDKNAMDNRIDSSHSCDDSAELKTSVVGIAIPETSQIQICSPSKLSHSIFILFFNFCFPMA